VGQGFSGSNSVLGVLGQHLLDEGLRLFGDLVPVFGRVLNVTVLVLNQDIVNVVSPENRAACQEYVQDYASAEDVSLNSVTAFLQQLGGDVAGGTAPQLQQLVGLDERSQAEISDSEIMVICLRTQNEILGLQISVNDSIIVDELKGSQHVAHDVNGRLLLVYLPALDPFEELTAVQLLQHQMDVLVTLVDFVQLDDVGVLEHPQDVDFLKNTLNISFALFYTTLLNCFEGIFLLIWITSPHAAVDFGEVASAEQGSQFEFFLQVEEDDGVFEGFQPLGDDLLIIVIKLESLPFGH